MFTLTKAVKVNAIEVTIVTTDVYDTILEVEGKLCFIKKQHTDFYIEGIQYVIQYILYELKKIVNPNCKFLSPLCMWIIR